MKRAIPVLMYHHVCPQPGLVTLSPDAFAQQMAAIAAAGYTSLTAAQFASFLAGGSVPRKSVLITFDDGYLDNYVYAHPVLQRYGLNAVLFLVTGWIGEGPPRPHAGLGDELPLCPDHRGCKEAIRSGAADSVMLRWSEVLLMRAAGTFEFHSHTHSHTRWDQLCTDPMAKRQQLNDDLALSRLTMRERLGAASEHLCWPQGYHDSDYREIAQTLGFRYLYTTNSGVNTQATPPEHIFRLVTKERPPSWILNRLRLYSHPWLGQMYSRWIHA